MARISLEQFLDEYGANVPFDADLRQAGAENDTSALLILRVGERVLVINPMVLADHIALDVHAFIDGQRAGMGMFGMTPGRRHDVKTGQPAKSHGFDAVGLATVILGSQDGDLWADDAEAGERRPGQSQVAVALAVLDYQREVLADINNQTLPTSVRSISDLNDHVDANEYAGFTSTRANWSTADLIRVQEIIDPWLAVGHPDPDGATQI
jgi:hypothetical protein